MSVFVPMKLTWRKELDNWQKEVMSYEPVKRTHSSTSKKNVLCLFRHISKKFEKWV